MDLFFVIVIMAQWALIVLLWRILYLIEKHTWNKGVCRETGEPWKYEKSVAYGCEHLFTNGTYSRKFHFRFDK